MGNNDACIHFGKETLGVAVAVIGRETEIETDDDLNQELFIFKSKNFFLSFKWSFFQGFFSFSMRPMNDSIFPYVQKRILVAKWSSWIGKTVNARPGMRNFDSGRLISFKMVMRLIWNRRQFIARFSIESLWNGIDVKYAKLKYDKRVAIQQKRIKKTNKMNSQWEIKEAYQLK